jgi:hypothetical protein
MTPRELSKLPACNRDDRRVERFNADLAGRPLLVKGNSQLLFGGMGRLTANTVLVMRNKSFSITAEVEVPSKGAEGVTRHQIMLDSFENKSRERASMGANADFVS